MKPSFPPKTYSFFTTVCLLLCMFTANLGWSQNQVNYLTFGGTGSDQCNDLHPTSDSGFVVVGASGSFSNNGVADVYLLKYDTTYQLEWSKLIGNSGIDQGNKIIQTSDKGYAIAGFTNSAGSGGYDMYLIKTDSVGNLEWDRTFGGSDWDFADALVQTPDGGYLIAGSTQSFGNGGKDIYIIKTDTNGVQMWDKIIGGSKRDLARDLLVMHDGNFLVVGETTADTTDSSDLYLAQLSPTGTVLWTETYGNSYDDGAHTVIQLQDSNLAIMGYTNTTVSNKDAYLIKVDTFGQELWNRIYLNGSSTPMKDDVGYDIRERDDGWLLLGINTENTSGNKSDYFSFVATPGGWWTSNSAQYGGQENEWLRGVLFMPDGKTLMAGTTETYGNGLADIFLVTVDTLQSYSNFNLSTMLDSNPLAITSIDDRPGHSHGNLSLFPNPASDRISFQLEGFSGNSEYRFSLYDLQGKRVRFEQLNSDQWEVLRGDLAAGMYLFQLESNEAVPVSGRVVFQ